MASTFRFAPPPLVVDRDLRWLLVRAFASAGTPCEPPEASAGLALAARTALAPRIAARTDRGVLEAELGDGAATLFESRRSALAHALAYEDVARRIATVAAGQPVVLLKGAALLAGGYAAPGSRDLGDLDVLVPEDEAATLYSTLVADGFAAGPGKRNEHHLPPLSAPSWGTIDLHDAVRGVAGETDGWMTAGESLAVGKPLRTDGGCWVPDRDLLVAHALAHTLDQHGASPQALPLLRMLADLDDLLPAGADWDDARDEVTRRLRDSVAPSEVSATEELAATLRRGELPPASSKAGLLLAHLVAHAVKPDYRAGLRGAHRRRRLTEAWRRGSLLRYVLRKFGSLGGRGPRR